MITILAKENASSRTKNRIAEHGPRFTLIKIDFPQCMNFEKSILLKSMNKSWSGWLPLSEIEIESIG